MNHLLVSSGVIPDHFMVRSTTKQLHQRNLGNWHDWLLHLLKA